MYNFNGEILYENIKAICEMKNTTITALEREVGLSVPSISKWKDGNPTIQKILSVANALGVTIEYLLTSNIHETRNITSMFLESIYVKTDIRELAWKKGTKSDEAHFRNMQYFRDELLSYADANFDDDLSIYSTQVGEKTLYCVHFIIADDFTSDEVHIYQKSYHTVIEHEGIPEFLDKGATSQKLHELLDDISYYEPRRNSLNDFMSDFISKK